MGSCNPRGMPGSFHYMIKWVQCYINILTRLFNLHKWFLHLTSIWQLTEPKRKQFKHLGTFLTAADSYGHTPAELPPTLQWGHWKVEQFSTAQQLAIPKCQGKRKTLSKGRGKTLLFWPQIHHESVTTHYLS